MSLGLMGSWFTLACLMAQAPSAGPASPPLKFPADLSNPRAALESFSFAAEGIRRNVRGAMIAALTMCDLPEGARQDEARTLVAMLVANDFWHMTGQARFMAKNAFLEHLGLICALAMAARLAVLERKDME